MFRRVLRHAFTILSALSLLLCVAVCVLWGRSYWNRDGVDSPTRSDRSYALRSERGEIALAKIRWLIPNPNGDWTWTTTSLSPADATSGLEEPTYGLWFGRSYAFSPGYPAPYAEVRSCIVSDWLVVLICMTMPGIWIWRFGRYRRRRAKGLCVKCSYDLRASPARCPECGMPVQNPA